MPKDPNWRCDRCGSNHYVRASLTGPVSHGGKPIAQCVPCGRYQGLPPACVLVGPYLPVGDADWTCKTHDVDAELRRTYVPEPGKSPRREDYRCPISGDS